MVVQELIDAGILTAAGIGNVGELCCEDCIDHDGSDSMDLTSDSRCGDIRYEDGKAVTVEGIEVLINCDSCDSEVNSNRRILQGLAGQNEFDLETGEVITPFEEEISNEGE